MSTFLLKFVILSMLTNSPAGRLPDWSGPLLYVGLALVLLSFFVLLKALRELAAMGDKQGSSQVTSPPSLLHEIDQEDSHFTPKPGTRALSGAHDFQENCVIESKV